MTTLKKITKRRSLQNSDPGKILDLVMNLNDDTSSQLQIKINCYVSYIKLFYSIDLNKFLFKKK